MSPICSVQALSSPESATAKARSPIQTFDPQSVDVLRLDFVPEFVTAHGNPLTRRKDLDREGFVYDESTHVLRIRHDQANDIDVQGSHGQAPPQYVTFDDPHLPAETVLSGQYPSGVIDLDHRSMACQCAPKASLALSTWALADGKAATAGFDFHSPRVFVGIDVYNGGHSEAVLMIHAPNLPEVSFTLKPGELNAFAQVGGTRLESHLRCEEMERA